MFETSIIVPAFERPHHLRATLDVVCDGNSEVIVVDDGSADTLIRQTAMDYDVRYYRLDRRGVWKNPARALNVGIRAASGEFTIINHSGIVGSASAIQQIVTVLREMDVAVLAKVSENGVEVSGSYRPYFLLGGMRTSYFLRLRGYDEDFTEYGYEDDDFALRLVAAGVDIQHWREIQAEHLPHQRHYTGPEMERMRQLNFQKTTDMAAGRIGIFRNLGRDWGAR